MLRADYKIMVLAAALSASSLACSGLGATPDASVADTPSHGPVGRTMRSNSNKFAACGRDSVSVQTGSTQNVQLLFTIDPQGNVQKARVQQMSAPDPDLYGCVLRVLKRIHFPPPKDGKSKEITYPLVVRPD